MNRFSKLDATLELSRIDDQNTATLAPSAAAIGQLCNELSLLWHRLIGDLILECSERHQLMIKISENPLLSVGALGVWSPPSVRLTMSNTELERWLVFALKYHRDGAGEVDHIDLEARDAIDGYREVVFVTFKVPNAVQPLSPLELRRHLKKK